MVALLVDTVHGCCFHLQNVTLDTEPVPRHPHMTSILQLVHKVKSNHLLDRLAAWRVDELPEEEVCATLQELRQCLENIQVPKAPIPSTHLPPRDS